MKSVSDTLSTVQAKLAAYGFTPTTFPVLVSEPNEKGKRDKTP